MDHQPSITQALGTVLFALGLILFIVGAGMLYPVFYNMGTAPFMTYIGVIFIVIAFILRNL